MDLKPLSLASITIAGIIVFILKDFYVEYAMYFGWIMLYIVHLVIVSIILILISEKVRRFIKRNNNHDIGDVYGKKE